MHYKGLDAVDVPKVLIDGTIAISSLDYFRRLEESEWGAIADRLEGASELTTPSKFVVTENSPEPAMLNSANIGHGMSKRFASVTEGGVINISPAKFVSTIPGQRSICSDFWWRIGPRPSVEVHVEKR